MTRELRQSQQERPRRLNPIGEEYDRPLPDDPPPASQASEAADGAGGFPAKISASGGSGSYTAREQEWSGSAWGDKDGADDITVLNLAETTGGCTSAIPINTFIIVHDFDGAYWCDHTTNAMYKA